MNGPKYDIRDGRLFHRQGKYYVPDEEPVAVLRGKDPVALVALRAYADAALDDAHRASIRERIEAISAYQTRYPERTKVGCHNHE